MTFEEYKQLCQKYNLQLLSHDGCNYGVCNVSFVSWGNHIRVIPESVWNDEVLSDNGKYLTYKGEFQYAPDLISKKDPKTFENYLIKLNAWLKQIKAEQKIRFINEDFK